MQDERIVNVAMDLFMVDFLYDRLQEECRAMEEKLRGLAAEVRNAEHQITLGSNPDRVREAWLAERDDADARLDKLQQEYNTLYSITEVLHDSRSRDNCLMIKTSP